MGRFSWLEVPLRRKLKTEGVKELGEHDEGHYIELAETRYREGAYEAALRYYSRALGRDIKIERAWIGQLLCLINLGEYKEAIAWADKAMEVFPASSDILAAKAVSWARSGNFEKGLAFSDASLKLSSDSSFVWWARGDVIITENPRTADYCFTKAMELSKDDWALLLRIAQTFLSFKRPADARKYLVRARQLAPDNPVVWHVLGVAYREMDMTEDALKAFDRVLELNPHHRESEAAAQELRKTSFPKRLRLSVRRWLRT